MFTLLLIVILVIIYINRTKGDIAVYLKENYDEDEIKVKFRYENGFYTIDILNEGYPEQEFYNIAEERLNRLFDTIE